MIRILTTGVIKKFRHMGIDSCFYYETWKRGNAKGIYRGEMSWILENNAADEQRAAESRVQDLQAIPAL